jgi:ABC-type sugar transport system ATPase subunit
VVERLGSDQFLYGVVGADQVTARVDPRLSVTPGERVRLRIDIRGLHFFDAENERALL